MVLYEHRERDAAQIPVNFCFSAIMRRGLYSQFSICYHWNSKRIGSSSDFPSINLVNGIDRTGYTYAFASTILIRQLAIIAALVLAFTIFRKIGKGLSPFTDVVSKRIRTIGTLLIVAAIIAWPVGSLVAKAVWSDKTSYPIIINLDWGTLVFGFIISSLASIFRYGCVLQQASDETL